MTNSNHLRTRLAGAGITLALAASACSTGTTADTGNEVESTTTPTESVDSTAPEPVGTEPAPDTTPTADPGPEPEPATEPEPDAASAPEPEPDAGPEPDAAPEPAPSDAEAPCGDFGPIPPRPDSMPTVLFDTDGDGAIDDEVTAYGAVDGWRVRVVEDGIISEALVQGVLGFAALTEPIEALDGDHIGLRDFETDEVHHFLTGDDHCIASADPVDPTGPGDVADPSGVVRPRPIDDLDLRLPTPGPGSQPIDDLVAVLPDGDPTDGCWEPLPEIPDDALISSELWMDYDFGGVEDDRVVAYFDGTWKLRAEISGFEDEIEFPGAGVHGVQILGRADVGDELPGAEIIARVGGGASAIELGVFGFHELGCFFRYHHDGGDVFAPLAGGTIGQGSGIVCGDGEIGLWSYELQPDDTYELWGASFEETDLGVFGYVPASDGVVFGLGADELPDTMFDCNDLSL